METAQKSARSGKTILVIMLALILVCLFVMISGNHYISVYQSNYYQWRMDVLHRQKITAEVDLANHQQQLADNLVAEIGRAHV